MSSVVTPSDSARLPPPLPPLARSEPRFRPSVPLPLVAPPQYTLNPHSAVGRDSDVRQFPDSPQQAFGTLRIRPAFPRFPAPRKARLSANAPPLSSVCVCSVSSACFPPQPRAFRLHPNKPAKALVKARSRHHNTHGYLSMVPGYPRPGTRVPAYSGAGVGVGIDFEQNSRVVPAPVVGTRVQSAIPTHNLYRF
ncbi:hypothetical protein PGTUg99_025871 [Puccinia graminis f. sp. tritici]|uniref:Uncharacterized protein n=1 Tax=Puccinia graminis f. sp. tritici TaxID=56615 RepID=A0A5B0N236_PUCGR|nr:hypothetical protein PGTUg99_025871 [Puccinia graminis f. sp. tritici]